MPAKSKRRFSKAPLILRGNATRRPAFLSDPLFEKNMQGYDAGAEDRGITQGSLSFHINME
jgi:hypothetical protein